MRPIERTNPLVRSVVTGHGLNGLNGLK
jgi:hypothetical protein